MNPSENCGRCTHWRKTFDGPTPVGDCTANPPRVIDAIVAQRLAFTADTSEAVEDATRFPTTKQTDGCGKFATGWVLP